MLLKIINSLKFILINIFFLIYAFHLNSLCNKYLQYHSISLSTLCGDKARNWNHSFLTWNLELSSQCSKNFGKKYENPHLCFAVGGGPWRMLGDCTWCLLGPSACGQSELVINFYFLNTHQLLKPILKLIFVATL